MTKNSVKLSKNEIEKKLSETAVMYGSVSVLKFINQFIPRSDIPECYMTCLNNYIYTEKGTESERYNLFFYAHMYQSKKIINYLYENVPMGDVSGSLHEAFPYPEKMSPTICKNIQKHSYYFSKMMLQYGLVSVLRLLENRIRFFDPPLKCSDKQLEKLGKTQDIRVKLFQMVLETKCPELIEKFRKIIPVFELRKKYKNFFPDIPHAVQKKIVQSAIYLSNMSHIYGDDNFKEQSCSVDLDETFLDCLLANPNNPKSLESTCKMRITLFKLCDQFHAVNILKFLYGVLPTSDLFNHFYTSDNKFYYITHQDISITKNARIELLRSVIEHGSPMMLKYLCSHMHVNDIINEVIYVEKERDEMIISRDRFEELTTFVEMDAICRRNLFYMIVRFGTAEALNALCNLMPIQDITDNDSIEITDMTLDCVFNAKRNPETQKQIIKTLCTHGVNPVIFINQHGWTQSMLDDLLATNQRKLL